MRRQASVDRGPHRKKRRGLPRRAFTIALAVAFFLHLPLIPSRLGEWLRVAFFGETADYDDPDAQAILPLDLDLLGEAPSAETSPGSRDVPAAGNTATPPPKPPAHEAPAIADAGAPTDAGAPHDAGRPDAASAASAAADAGPPPLRDPVSTAGGAGKIAAKDANIQVLIAGNVIRKHELGAAFSRLLVLIPEWHQFFEDSPIDPIRDLNHLLITGPRFRGDSSKMVAVMDFNVPEPQIRAAVDLVIQRTGGEWLDDTPIPAAHAKILAGDRLFALVPGKKLLVVLPLDAKDQLAGFKQNKGFRNGTVGIVISLLTPARPFKSIFPLPETLKWLRVAVTPTADGGADVAVEVGDSSAEDAAKHAVEITKALDQVRTIDMMITRIDVIDHTEFTADADVMKARVHVTTRQLKLIMGFVEQRLKEQAAKQGAAAASATAVAGPASAPAPATAAPKASP
jgi:hypothetical protein